MRLEGRVGPLNKCQHCDTLIIDKGSQWEQSETRKTKDNTSFDTTELYLNLIQVSFLYRVYLQDLKSEGKKTEINKH